MADLQATLDRITAALDALPWLERLKHDDPLLRPSAREVCALLERERSRRQGGAARRVLDALQIREAPKEIYRAGETQLDIVFDERTLHLDPTNGTVLEEGDRPLGARPVVSSAFPSG